MVAELRAQCKSLLVKSQPLILHFAP